MTDYEDDVVANSFNIFRGGGVLTGLRELMSQPAGYSDRSMFRGCWQGVGHIGVANEAQLSIVYKDGVSAANVCMPLS